MENPYEIKSLASDGITIASLFEGDDCKEYSHYFPHITLLFIRQGRLKVRHRNEECLFIKGTFCLIKKHTQAQLSAVSTKAGQVHKIIKFTLNDSVVKEALRHITLPGKTNPVSEHIVSISKHTMLEGFIFSIRKYLDALQEIDNNLLFIKTMELLIGIIKSNTDLASVFYEYSLPKRADLIVFMETICYEKLTLPQMARLSGRSTAAFNRDFRKTFQVPPHQWLKQKRLNYAKELLLKTNKKPSEIYLVVGFEDLAHFSRSFKKQFGINPSQLKGDNNI